MSFLLVDDCSAFVDGISRSFRDLGHTLWVAKSFPEALVAAELCKPDFVVSELRIGSRFIFDFLPELGARKPLNRLVVATIFPSVATAVRLVRLGVAAYFTKPVSASVILSELSRAKQAAPPAHHEPDPDPDPDPDPGYSWPSLNRTIWEYLNQVYMGAGSMSEAARRLGLDRRSLRRMLAKYPPSR